MSDRLPLIQILKKPPEPPAASDPATPATVRWPAVVEQLRQAASSRPQTSVERCEFCGTDIDAAHGHLVDLPRRALLCVCRPCYLLFTHDGAGGVRFRAVPDRYALVPELAGARGAWDALQIPIGLAFFFRNGTTGRTIAFYPSPAGATESELPLEAWEEITHEVPVLATLAADVEALLVRRQSSAPDGHEGGRRVDALIVPIDACYELVGRIRRSWRGFHGGDEVWREIDDFFERATARASAV